MREPLPARAAADPGDPILCLVVDAASSRGARTREVGEACGAGVDWLQLRDRELAGAAWLDWAESLAQSARAHAPGIRIIANRRLDMALAMGADGVHLGFDAASPGDARTLMGPNARVGASTHAPSEIACLAPDEIDYVHLAPIYAPLSKPASRPELGLALLARACEGPIPVIAQGGLGPERCSAVIRAGAAGVAVTGGILSARNPADAAAGLRAALDGGR